MRTSPQLLTDDGDFCTVPGIQLFTANRQVQREAVRDLKPQF